MDFSDASPQDWSAGRDTYNVVFLLEDGTPKPEILGLFVGGERFANASVRRVYAELLGREPDGDARYWTDRIPRGMAVEWVEQNVMASEEYGGRAQDASWVAEHLYPDVLGRPGSRAEGEYWASRVGQLGRLGVVRAIWYSPEGVGGRVADNYAELLGRPASAGEVDWWRASEARSDLATRVAIAASPEYARALAPGTHPVTADTKRAADLLDAVGYRRWDLVHSLMMPESQAAIGGEDGLSAARPGLVRDLGALAKIPRRGYTATIVDERATAVTVAGDVQRDGVATFETASLGVRGTPSDRTPLVDVSVPTVGLALEPADRTLDRGEPLTLAVDRRGQGAWVTLLVDGRLDDLPREAGRTQTTFTVPAPPQDWPRRSVVTAVAQLDDGRLQAESAVFTRR